MYKGKLDELDALRLTRNKDNHVDSVYVDVNSHRSGSIASPEGWEDHGSTSITQATHVAKVVCGLYSLTRSFLRLGENI